MIGVEESSDVTFVIGFTAGGALILAIIGMWVKYRWDKNHKGGPDEPS